MLESEEVDGERGGMSELLEGDEIVFAPLRPGVVWLTCFTVRLDAPAKYCSLSSSVPSGSGEEEGSLVLLSSALRCSIRPFGTNISLHPSTRNGVRVANPNAFIQLLAPLTESGIAKPS